MNDVISTLKYAQIGREAEEAARMQKVAAAAKMQGASEYAKGLADLAAESAYMNTVTQPGEAASKYIGVNNPYSGQVNFVPAGLASYERELAQRNAPTPSLVANNAPVHIVGDPRVAPARYEDRSGFGKTLEVVTSQHNNPNSEYFAF